VGRLTVETSILIAQEPCKVCQSRLGLGVSNMKLRPIEGKVKRLYNADYAKNYRVSDSDEYGSPSFNEYRNILQYYTSINETNQVLDLGCGTGRYFSCLENTIYLLGIDISLPMLLEAKKPISKDKITITQIDLLCASIFGLHLPSGKFDMVYSFGVLGEHSPFTSEICEAVFNTLKANGIFFFTVVDIDSKRIKRSLKRRMIDLIYPICPAAIQNMIDAGISHYMTFEKLENIMVNSSFREFDITRRVENSHGWSGAHFNCIAKKKE